MRFQVLSLALLAILAHCTLADDAADKPAGKTPPEAISTAHISGDFQLAIVCRPDRVLDSPLLAALLGVSGQTRDGVVADMTQHLGFDPRDLRQATFLAGVRLGAPDRMTPFDMSFGAVVRSTKKLDLAKVAVTLGRGAQPARHEGREYWRAQSSYAPSAFLVDDHTLAFAQEVTLLGMMSTKKSKGELAERLRKLSPTHDAVAVVECEGFRKFFQKALDGPGGVPFFLAPLFSALANDVKTVTGVADLSGETLLQITVEASSPAAAKKLQTQLTSAVNLSKLVLKNNAENLPDDVTKQGAALLEDLLGAVQVERNEGEIQLTLAAPKDLARRAADLAQLAGRKRRMDDLSKIGVALHSHHGEKETLPTAAIRDKNGKPLLSWRVSLLPYLGRKPLYAKFHFDEAWDSPHNKALLKEMPSFYASPGGGEGLTNIQGVLGSKTIFGDKQALAFRHISDGTANTLVIVETDPARAVPWTKPSDYVYDSQDPAAGLGLPGEDSFLAVFCDSTVQRIKKTIDADTLRACTPTGAARPSIARACRNDEAKRRKRCPR